MSKNNDTKLFVVTHKAFNAPNLDSYIPIQVGKQFTNIDLGYCSDDTGINIANKNKNYCELTAHYWAWKNLSDYKYVGFLHYRRYLTKAFASTDAKHFLSEENVVRYLRKYDLIVPKKYYWTKKVSEIYVGAAGYSKDLDQTRKSIAKISPDYLASYDKILNDYSAFYCNVFVTRKELFEEYSAWLFAVLEDVEREIDISSYSTNEARVFGFLSEILLNVWIEKNEYSFKEIRLASIERSAYMSVRTDLSFFKRRIIHFFRSVFK